MARAPGQAQDQWADPVQGYRTYLVLRDWFLHLAIGAALALAAFGGLSRLVAVQPWLKATVAEGLVAAASILVLALVMVGLSYVYMGRILKRRVLAQGQPLPVLSRDTPGAMVSLIAILWLIGMAGVTALLVWSEYAFQDAVAQRRSAPTTLDRAIFGQVSPSYAGMTGTITIISAVFMLGAWVSGREPTDG